MKATFVRAEVDATSIVVHIEDDPSPSLIYSSETLRPFTERAARAPHLVEFFEVFLALYSADRLIKRRGTWQRHFVVEFPVTQVEAWREVTPLLKQLVHQSMGDDVEFTFIKRAGSQRHADNLSVHFALEESRPTSVVLLSDGLDSLCGALQHLGAHQHERVSFVSLTTNNRKVARIARIRDFLQSAYQRDVSSCSSHLHFDDPPRADAQEQTQRSRTMLAIAAGLVTAACYGTDEIFISENGVGILNLPVPFLQMDHHSSQVLHPANRALWSKLSQVLLGTGGHVRYSNRFRTKAEMCAGIPEFARSLICHTSSCDRPDRYDKYDACGRCGSCIVRKRALQIVRLTKFDDRYSSRQRRPNKRQFDPAEVQLYHARELKLRLAKADPWAALVTYQPTLATTVLFEGEDPTHVRFETMSLLQRHVDEVIASEDILRAG